MTSALSDWTRVRGKIESFRYLERNNELYENLILSGVEQNILDNYLDGSRSRKAEGCKSKNPKEIVKQLLKMGGIVAGGAAIKVWQNKDEPRDWDVFFDDYSKWVNGFLLAFKEPKVDVCLSLTPCPYEPFDIWASCCAFDSTGFSIHQKCVESFETNRSDIRIDKIIHPVATLRRVVKYAKTYDLKFSEETIQKLISIWQVTNYELIEEALIYSY